MKRPVIILLAAACAACAACADTAPTEFSSELIACSFGRATVLTVGSVLSDAVSGARFCLDAPDGGTFLLVPFVSGAGDTTVRVTVSIFGGGLSQPPDEVEFQRPRTTLLASPEAANLIEATDAWHAVLRARERTELPVVQSAGRETSQVNAFSSAAQAVPAPGDLLQINTSTRCDITVLRPARVAVVTNHAIVAFDTTNPRTGAFNDSDWRRFGREFDELVHPVNTQAFGQESDIDGNGRTILFFSRAVNEIVPPGGGVGVVGGFFWRGDLFPRNGIPNRVAPCAGSNEREILFLAAPDPNGEVRGIPLSDSTLAQVMTATIAHEFQHLINSAHRLYVTSASVLEDTWLNEGLSYIAEELLFYAASGLGPGQNLDANSIRASNQRTDSFNHYAVGNLGRLNVFVQAPQDWSLMGKDGIPTRGAAWSFLRYVADRDPRPDIPFFKALIDGQTAGLANLAAALGQDPLPWMQDWSVSIFADDFVSGLDARFQQPSWNARDLIAALRIDQRYPLRLLPVEPGPGFSVRLQQGSAAYPLFSLTRGARAIIVLGTEGETADNIVRTLLMRVQ